MEALWSCRLEGDRFERMVVQADRATVSTEEQTVVVSRQGQVLERYQPPPPVRPNERWSVPLGERRYTLEAGALVAFDARGFEISRTALPSNLGERYREQFFGGLVRGTPVAEMLDARMRDAWSRTELVPDPERGVLLATDFAVPWLAMLRTDGVVEWLLLLGSPWDCCNRVAVVANDGLLAYFSSCGSRLTFVTTSGQIASTHALDGLFGAFSTNRRGVVYLVNYDGRIAAYRSGVGRTLTVEVPNVWHADARDGILYTVIRHPSDGMLVVAFREPA